MSNNEFIEYAREIELELYNLTKNNLNKKFKEISSFVVEIFRTKFCNEENNIPRAWNRLEEKEIDDLYQKNKKEVNIINLVVS